MAMKIIMGLGNPGRQYERTPHNVGFEVVDELAGRMGVTLREQPRAQALVGEGRLGSHAAMLVKPLTFMNRSGRTAAALTRQREIGEDDLLVIADDVNLPIGRIRLRPGGRSGGQKGLQSVIDQLGRDDFSRLRVGIAPEWAVEDLVDFVLRRLPPLERAQLDEMVVTAAEAVEQWAAEGVAAAMDRFNGWRRFAPESDT